MSEIKYKSEIDKIFEDCFKEDWMAEDDWSEFLTLLNIDYKKMGDEIEIGIKNGYSLDNQLLIIRKMLKI